MVEGSKHTPDHNKWDAGGYCNELVLDENGDAEVCGYIEPGTRKFQKKPVVIEAVQLNHYYDDATFEKFYGNIDAVAQWINNNGGTAVIEHDPTGDFGLVIKTLEGEMYADYKDWIIKGVEGEFYPCKPDIFAKTYEEVKEPPTPKTQEEKIAFRKDWDRRVDEGK